MPFTQTPTITGNLVALRPPTPDDVVALRAGMADRDVTVLTGSTHSSSAAEVDHDLDKLQQIYTLWANDPTRLVWAIVERATQGVIGEVLLTDLDEGNRSCGFRIWIAGATGRGLGTEATRLAVGHGFESCGLNRIQLEVYAFNPRARRVYEKVGFVLEGTLRQALRFDDGWVDAHLMAVLAEDWRRHGGYVATAQ